MSKVQKILSKTSDTFRDLFKNFPVTIVTIIIVTIIQTITVGAKFIGDDIQEIIKKFFLFGFIFSIEAFFLETNFKNKNVKFICYIISEIISFTFMQLIFVRMYQEHITPILVGFLLILISLSLYKILKKHNLKFREYVLVVFSNVFKCTIIYLILNIGLTLLSIVFIELILDGEYGIFIIRTQILLLGLFYIPAIINSVSSVKEKAVNLFIQGLVKFVLLPLITIGVAIIYIYIIKIIILQQIPSNVVFRILTCLFIIAFPVWNLADNFSTESKAISKIVNILPYLYIPFIILEIYSLGIRIFEFGITPDRYFGIIFIALQVISLIFTFIKEKEKMPELFIVIAILLFITFMTPLNYKTISLLNQKARLVKYIKEDTSFQLLSEQDKHKAFGAYEYLIYNNGEKYIPGYINTEELMQWNNDSIMVKNIYQDILIQNN